jgi:predicted AlkP superfamily pyrophosphatase or phosphodiesterase
MSVRHLASVIALASFLLLSWSLWVGLGSNLSPVGAQDPANAAGTPSPSSYAVIVVVDGARADSWDLSKMPHVAALARAGTAYSNAWVGQLPSVTEASHATIGTGVFPRRHTILGDTWRVPNSNHMSPNLLDGNLDRTGYIGKTIRQTNSPSLAATIHAAYRNSVVVALSGHKIYAADAMGAGRADFVAFGGKNQKGQFVPQAMPGHTPDPSILSARSLVLPSYPRKPGLEDGWTIQLAEKFLTRYHPKVLMINLPEIDVIGHAAGTGKTVMQPLMQQVDQEVGQLVAAYKKAGLFSQTDFLLTSDHGMIPAAHTVLSSRLYQIIEAAGGQPLYVGHGDYATVWLKNQARTPQVAAGLARAHIPYVRAVYQKASNGKYIPAAGSPTLSPALDTAYTDLLSTFAGPESPDVVLLYDNNTITMTSGFLKIGRKGDHEGANWGSQHIAFFLSGPGVKSGYTSPYPARLVDIAPTIETLLGTHPHHQDGVVLADSMVNPPAWAQPKQSRMTASLTADMLAVKTAKG